MKSYLECSHGGGGFSNFWSNNWMEGGVDDVSPVKVEEDGGEARDNPVWNNQIVGQEEGDISETIENGIYPAIEEYPVEPKSKNGELVKVGEHGKASSCLRTEDLVIDRTIHHRPRL